MRVFARSVLPALGLVLVLAGCASRAVLDQLPPSMAEPADAPAAPAAPYQYPAVHDMPPPRQGRPMNEDEQLRAEKDLAGVRDRQERLYSEKTTKKSKVAAKKKKKAKAAANGGQATGAKTSP